MCCWNVWISLAFRLSQQIIQIIILLLKKPKTEDDFDCKWALKAIKETDKTGSALRSHYDDDLFISLLFLKCSFLVGKNGPRPFNNTYYETISNVEICLPVRMFIVNKRRYACGMCLNTIHYVYYVYVKAAVFIIEERYCERVCMCERKRESEREHNVIITTSHIARNFYFFFFSNIDFSLLLLLLSIYWIYS